MTSTDRYLSCLGWDDATAESFRTCAPAGTRPARVTRVDRGACDVLVLTRTDPSHAVAAAHSPEPTHAPDPALAADAGAATPGRAALSAAVLSASARDPAATPCVGDWVAVRAWPDGRTTLEGVLPRRTAIIRAAVAPGTSHGQVLAANVDLAIVVEGLRPEPDLGRIERLLALSWESGATPAVVLTKADLVTDAEAIREEVGRAAPGVEVHAVSATTGEGVAALRACARPGCTIALLGPSGAGKSTLTNALAGGEVMTTRALRVDGKGRHTTAHRELVVLPGGGLVIDTPGLRSVGLTALDTALEHVFTDIEELAQQCRFDDCAHAAEPGCAVLAAVERGEVAERRLTSWHKLQREARYMAMRHDARLRSAERARWKRVTADVRRSGRVRP